MIRHILALTCACGVLSSFSGLSQGQATFRPSRQLRSSDHDGGGSRSRFSFGGGSGGATYRAANRVSRDDCYEDDSWRSDPYPFSFSLQRNGFSYAYPIRAVPADDRYWRPPVTHSPSAAWTQPPVAPTALSHDRRPTPAPNWAHLDMLLPADTTLWVQGVPMTLQGTQSRFTARNLEPGYTYSYEVTVKRTPKVGPPVTYSYSLELCAGEWKQLALTPSGIVPLVTATA